MPSTPTAWRRSPASVRLAYRYFANKSGRVAALIDEAQRRLADAVAVTLAEIDGASLAVSVGRLVDVAIDHQFGRPVLAAALDPRGGG